MTTDPLKLARDALELLMKHYPTDSDMVEAGWSRSTVSAACDAYDKGRAALAAIDAMPASVPATGIDEAQLARMTERGAVAWAGVTDADVRALRDGDVPAAKKPHGCEHLNGQFCGKAGPCLYPQCAPTVPAAPAPAAVPASEPNESLVIGQAQQLIGALIAHRLLHKSMPEPDYINLWDVVKRHLRLVNKEGARTMSAAPAVAAPEPLTLTDAQIERHGMPASECPPDSEVMLVSSIRRLLGMAAAPTTQEPQHG